MGLILLIIILVLLFGDGSVSKALNGANMDKERNSALEQTHARRQRASATIIRYWP